MVANNKIIDVFVEIPTGSQNKYEYDKDKGVFKLDRVLFSSQFYPAEYGYIDETLALDDDPLDALVIVTNPTFPGCVIESKVLGFLNMVDDGEEDQKLIAVPVEDPRFENVETLDDLPQHKLEEIKHFFDTYKDLQGKETQIGEYEDADAASKLIDECLERYQNN
ncbi:inorganic diphosphatase [Alkalibacillus almallahensis]|uniref:inorganic diphosphatase n=1 Tax=Alkalibacillus almallahensis TaxID=1379154 RepID=UPI00141EBC67